ncbi:MAG: L,D-transpeptidase family protein [Acidimicrobiales bacterium]
MGSGGKLGIVAAVLAVGLVAAGAGIALAVGSGPGPGRLEASPGSTSTSTSTTERAAPPALEVVLATPDSGASGVDGSAPVSLHFSAALDPSAGLPQLAPAVEGSWSRPDPSTLVFTPSVGFLPDTTETLTVPSGHAGERSRSGGTLARPLVDHWTVANGSVQRLQQLLAELGYLPLGFSESTPVPHQMGAEVRAAFHPPAGSFSWRWPGTPAGLQSLWQAGSYGVMTKGAVMQFESESGLAADGIAGPKVWAALLQAAVSGRSNQGGYSWVDVRKAQPQQLVVWHDGATVLTSPTNTGVPGAVTPSGTWPVYARYRSDTMTGTDPDGTHYVDPGVPYVNYFLGGDAVHGFTRAQYGSPQSNGCVELPISAAATAWGYLSLGSLVTIQ